MRLKLITLSGTKYDEDVYGVQLSTKAGEIGVYADHEPLLSVLVPGVIEVQRTRDQKPEQREIYASSGGVLEITNGDVRILVDEADHSEEINEAEAERARQQAEQLLKGAKSQVEIEQAQALVDRHAVRLRVADLRRRQRSRR